MYTMAFPLVDRISSKHVFIEVTWWFCMSGSDNKKSACNVGDLGSISRLGRSPGDGIGYSLQYSGLENSTDRGAWQTTVHGVAKSQT
jgi:hypothetical protein